MLSESPWGLGPEDGPGGLLQGAKQSSDSRYRLTATGRGASELCRNRFASPGPILSKSPARERRPGRLFSPPPRPRRAPPPRTRRAPCTTPCGPIGYATYCKGGIRTGNLRLGAGGNATGSSKSLMRSGPSARPAPLISNFRVQPPVATPLAVLAGDAGGTTSPEPPAPALTARPTGRNHLARAAPHSRVPTRARPRRGRRRFPACSARW